LAFWAFISFYFGFLGLHFLSFWLFGPSFPFILAFWAFISFHFGLLNLPKRPSRQDLVKIAISPLSFALFPFQKFAALGLHFGLWGFMFSHFSSWAFISFLFGLLGLHFPVILAY